MRDREEVFISSPKEVFQQEIVDTRIECLAQKLDSLEEKVDRLSKMMMEILRRLEPSKNIFEVRTQKRYGFEAEEEVG
jgi:tetrahydromethanopterin S-methyltransferase subunit B